MEVSYLNSVLKIRAVRFTLVLLSGLIVALLLLEIFLRVFDPIGISYYFEARRYGNKMTLDPDFGYIHTPGYQAKLQGVDVSINSHGFRAPEFVVEKGQKQRLMILGDSVVFGWEYLRTQFFPRFFGSG